MVDENRTKTAFGGRTELPTPTFDEHASAKAQPVMPIRKSIGTRLFENVSQLFTSSSRSLALVVALGIATGAVVGMALVKEPQSSLAGAHQSDSVLANGQAHPIPELQVAEIGVYGIQDSSSRNRRSTVRRSRVPYEGKYRAYRFAVIR